MKNKKIIELINKVETNFPVNSLIHQDRKIWPLIRFFIVEECQRQSDLSVNFTEGSKKNRRFELLKLFCISLLNLPRLSLSKRFPDVLFLFRSVDLHNRKGNPPYNRFFDALIDVVNFEFVSLGYTRSKRVFRQEESYQSIDSLIVLSKIFTKFSKKKSFRHNPHRSLVVTLFNQCKEEYPDLGFDITRLTKRIDNIFELCRLLKPFLRRIKPRSIFLICFYSDVEFAMSLAAHDLGINSVEFQHGAQNNVHCMYTNWNAIPKEGYEFLPKIFWSWGAISKNRIDSWAQKTSYHEAIVGGFPWLTLAKKENLLSTEEKTQYFPGSSKHIIVSLQRSEPLVPEHVKIAFHNLKDITTWHFRAHPKAPISERQLKEILQVVEGEKIDIDFCSNRSLYAVLQNCDVHLTGFSTVAFEAESFGVPTIFWDKNAVDGYDDIIGQGSFSYASESEALTVAIKKHIDVGAPELSSIPENERYIQTSSEIINNALQKCLKKPEDL